LSLSIPAFSKHRRDGVRQSRRLNSLAGSGISAASGEAGRRRGRCGGHRQPRHGLVGQAIRASAAGEY